MPGGRYRDAYDGGNISFSTDDDPDRVTGNRRGMLAALQACGLAAWAELNQVHGDALDQYSWWSYKTRAREKNIGWRIDYFFVSEELAPAVSDAWIESDVRGSDHCPVGLALDV